MKYSTTHIQWSPVYPTPAYPTIRVARHKLLGPVKFPIFIHAFKSGLSDIAISDNSRYPTWYFGPFRCFLLYFHRFIRYIFHGHKKTQTMLEVAALNKSYFVLSETWKRALLAAVGHWFDLCKVVARGRAQTKTCRIYRIEVAENVGYRGLTPLFPIFTISDMFTPVPCDVG